MKGEGFRGGMDLREKPAHSLTFLLIEMLPVLVARIGEAFSGCAMMRGKRYLADERVNVTGPWWGG